MRQQRFQLAVVLTLAAAVVVGCQAAPHAAPTASGTAGSAASGSAAPGTSGTPNSPNAHGSAESAAPGVSKILIIAEENHAYGQIVGAADAPYLNRLATTYGSATRLDAGYPAKCPSLAAYILLTSGSTQGICDDRGPKSHPLRGDSIFGQVAASGRQWRAYAESAPGPCALNSSRDGRYLVRHVPATYYVGQRSQCARWALPLGGLTSGALHDDVAAGALPAYGFISPDACDDMHGALVCPGNRVGPGDRWLQNWLPQILDGPDYRAGRLAVVITFDEGTDTDNHIPTVVVAPGTRHVSVDIPFTHCSILRTAEDLLRLPALGCAATAPSMVAPFHL